MAKPAVRDGSLDIGVATLPVAEDEGLRFVPWREDELQLIIPEDHALAGRKRFAVPPSKANRWSCLRPTPPCGGSSTEALEDAGVSVQLAMELRSIESIKQMVAQGIFNAISSIIIIGALIQVSTDNTVGLLLATAAIFITSINIVGGFAVTQRMLKMFRK